MEAVKDRSYYIKQIFEAKRKKPPVQIGGFSFFGGTSNYFQGSRGGGGGGPISGDGRFGSKALRRARKRCRASSCSLCRRIFCRRNSAASSALRSLRCKAVSI